MISYIIPTHDRPDDLALTLANLGKIDHAPARELLGGAEVIVIDNASRFPATAPPVLPNGLPVRLIYRPANEGAAARNAGAHSASGPGARRDHWLVMLDDDSAPLDGGHFLALAQAPADVAAIGADIFLTPPAHDGNERATRRESGGLPEVIIGCGAAIRRSAFLEAGGYDASFNYYAEEYDLCAKLLLAGHRVAWDASFRVHHRKVSAGRDMNAILQRLVRNNSWVEARYAPHDLRDDALAHVTQRYAAIADRENAREGYERGAEELRRTLTDQPRREMPRSMYERFTGLAHARAHLRAVAQDIGPARVHLIEPAGGGKHAALVAQAARDAGLTIVGTSMLDSALAARLPALAHACDALLVATLSPGPMLDTASALRRGSAARVLTPWSVPGLLTRPVPMHAAA